MRIHKLQRWCLKSIRRRPAREPTDVCVAHRSSVETDQTAMSAPLTEAERSAALRVGRSLRRSSAS
jgi:hypothetical protein